MITFQINHKAYTVDIGDDPDKSIEEGIKRFLDIHTNLTEKDVLLAYIKKSHELVALEKSLQQILNNSNG